MLQHGDPWKHAKGNQAREGKSIEAESKLVVVMGEDVEGPLEMLENVLKYVVMDAQLCECM